MKKLAFSLIACLAFVQPTYAATTALTESLLEYEAITSAIGTDPEFQGLISTYEFIVDIKRITPKVNIIGTVKYRIITRVLNSTDDVNALVEQNAFRNRSRKCCKQKKQADKFNTYIATLNISTNPAIGPNLITVTKIKQAP